MINSIKIRSKKVILAVTLIVIFVAFLIYGHINKNPPILLLEKLSFYGDVYGKDIPDSLLDIVRDEFFIINIDDESSFEKLSSSKKNINKSKENLKKGILYSNLWLNEHATWENDKLKTVSADDILKTPYVTDPIIGIYLSYMAGKFRIDTPPVSTTSLKTFNYVTENLEYSDEKNKEFYFNINTTHITFPVNMFDDEFEINQIQDLGESFAKGVAANIYFYIKKFLDNSNKELLRIEQLENELDKFMLKCTRPSAQVVLYNDTQAPIILGTQFFININYTDGNGEKKSKKLLMHTSNNAADRKPNSAPSYSVTSKDEYESNYTVTPIDLDTPSANRYDIFQDATDKIAYIFVPPRSEVRFDIDGLNISENELTTNIIDSYKYKYVVADIIGVDLSGNKITSKSMNFGISQNYPLSK